jgi:rare lipoprotein A
MKITTTFLLLFAYSSYSQIKITTKEEFIEEGFARYYANHLHGQYTSFGEIYNNLELTASHSRYPLNSLLKVTNLENNLSIQVRVNDYCKCEENKIINLSKEAASKLAMITAGKAWVRVERISQAEPKQVEYNLNSFLIKEKNISTDTINNSSGKTIKTRAIDFHSSFLINKTYTIYGIEKLPKGFGIQVTALLSLNMIKYLYDELIRIGVRKDEIFVQVGLKDSIKIYRIIFGEFSTEEFAKETLKWFSQYGYKGVVRYHLTK